MGSRERLRRRPGYRSTAAGSERDTDALTYHLRELATATDPRAPGHALPTAVPERGRILDVGCGAGQTLIALRAPRGRAVVGIDVDSRALGLGRSLMAEASFVCGQVERLPFGDGAFDFVIARVTLPYTHIAQALAEIARVLRDGGVCWLTLHPLSVALRQMWRHLCSFQLKGLMYQIYVVVNGLFLHLCDRQFPFPLKRSRIESFQTSRSMRRLLDAAGFADVEIERAQCFVVTARKVSTA